MKFLLVGSLVALAIVCQAPAHAADWPTKPVRIVVPYPPGGNVDVAARIIAPGLQAAFGQPFIVDNKSGAGGMIGAEDVARSAPDGYTLFLAANGPLLFSPVIFQRAAYRWDKDFVPISSVSFTPLVLQVRPSLPAQDVQQLLAMARKEPGKLTMASPGAGTTNHLVSELLQSLTGVHWTTAHYKGNAPATTDLLGGQVDFNFDQVSVSLPFIKEGKVRPLAVTTASRVPSLPNVPTFAEAGVQGMEASTFTGLLAPKGTPADIVERLSLAMQKILKEKDVMDRFDGLGAEARGSTPEAFREYLSKEDARWTPIIKNAHITAN
jgi:tripartite-type tricarboxylate transporter receptor subunit TctC